MRSTLQRGGFLLLLSFLSATACGSSEDASQSESDIIGGKGSGASEDWVVMIGQQYMSAAGNHMASPLCTGTLIAPNLVVTALHCFGDPNYHDYAGVKGHSTCQSGKQTGAVGDYKLYKPKSLFIKVGHDLEGKGYIPKFGVFPYESLSPEALGKEFVLPDDQCLFGDDFGFLVLDRDVDAPIGKLRNRLVAKGEGKLTAIGWGNTGNDFSDATLTRKKKTGLSVAVVGPKDLGSAGNPNDFDHLLAASEFQLKQKGATCFGDSGSPLVDADKAVVGVLSRGDDADCHVARTTYGSPRRHTDLVTKALARAAALRAAAND